MSTMKLVDYQGLICIEEIDRDGCAPVEHVYRWPTAIKTKDWIQNYCGDYLIGHTAHALSTPGLYWIEGSSTNQKISLAQGGQTKNIGYEKRAIPPPKRIKQPYYRDYFWRNKKGEAIC